VRTPSQLHRECETPAPWPGGGALSTSLLLETRGVMGPAGLAVLPCWVMRRLAALLQRPTAPWRSSKMTQDRLTAFALLHRLQVLVGHFSEAVAARSRSACTPRVCTCSGVASLAILPPPQLVCRPASFVAHRGVVWCPNSNAVHGVRVGSASALRPLFNCCLSAPSSAHRLPLGFVARCGNDMAGEGRVLVLADGSFKASSYGTWCCWYARATQSRR
jgi:hypothetical protein